MRHIIFVFFLLINCLLVSSQNIGQDGDRDSLINYIDIQGNKQGKWIKKYKTNQTAYEAYFVNNVLVGDYKRYYMNGKLMAHIVYNETGDTGACKMYYDNAILAAEGLYINVNVKHGTWKYYGVDGKLVSQNNYKAGIYDGEQISYYRNGNKSEVITYKDSIKHGVWRRYYEDRGNVQMETMHVNGKRDGLFHVFWDNGRLRIKGRYSNDSTVGTWIYYNEDGSIRREDEYVNGRRINQDELDLEFGKQVIEREKDKGKIPEPTEEIFYRNLRHFHE